MSPVHVKAVVIGGSAGSVEALTTLLSVLPEQYGIPVIAVVHLPPDSKSLLADILQPHCKLIVQEIEDKTPLLPGHVYLAPPDYHVLPESHNVLSLSAEEEVLFSRPSIDVLFETAADSFDGKVVGVVMTGANEDGARGLKKIIDAGGLGLIQDPATAYAPMMPRAAEAACPTAKLMTLSQIGEFLTHEVSSCR